MKRLVVLLALVSAVGCVAHKPKVAAPPEPSLCPAGFALHHTDVRQPSTIPGMKYLPEREAHGGDGTWVRVVHGEYVEVCHKIAK